MVNTETINLFDVGVLVNLRIRSWSGRKMVTVADMAKLDVNIDAIPDELVNLGRKLMVPKKEIRKLGQIEQQARQALDRWSVPFGIASASFVPLKMMPTVNQQLQDLKNEYYTRVDSFVSRFDELVAKVRNDHPNFWEKCLKNHYPDNKQVLREKFKFEWFTFQVAGIDNFAEVTIEEAIAMQNTVAAKEKELKSQMKEEVRGFVKEYVEAMRGETLRFCELMSARVTGSIYRDEDDVKQLTPRSIGCFRRYIDRFSQMNIFGDDKIEEMLRDFRRQFLSDGITPSDFEAETVKNGVKTTLDKIISVAAMESESANKFVGELQRRVTL